MTLEVPKDAKVYTTKYDHYKGVDYTNDPSNVWYRRSPNGKNMLPDLDGKPYKRPGWKVELTETDFFKACCGEYITTKVYHRGEEVIYQGELYVCSSSIAGGNWNASYWGNVKEKNATAEEFSSSKNYLINEFCKYEDKLYISNTVILAGDFDESEWDYVLGEVKQLKVDYFELGGADWLIFFTTLGIFVYNDSLTYISEYEDYPYLYYRPLTGTYALDDYTRYGVPNKYYKCTVAIGTPEVWTVGHWTEVTDNRFPKSFASYVDAIDYNKSFFFEGNGTAGYYIFADDELFMFDGQYLRKQEPYCPTVLIGCDADGAGTLYESVNLLGQIQAVQYSCDGTTAIFTVPGGFHSTTVGGTTWADGIINVYTRDANGKWVINTDWTRVDDTRIDFDSNPPQVVVQGEDNLRIVYIPAGATATDTVLYTEDSMLNIYKYSRSLYQQEKKGNSWVTTKTLYKDKVEYVNEIKPTFYPDSPKAPFGDYINAQVQKKDKSWSTDNTRVGLTINSYGTKVTAWSHGYGKDVFEYYYGYDRIDNGEEVSYSSGSTKRTKSVVHSWERSFRVRLKYTQRKISGSQAKGKNAFLSASRSLIFGNGIINQVFITTSADDNYSTRVWWSAATNPLYFPDTNYIEVGGTDKRIVGLIKVGDYLGIIKQGSGTDTSVYLAYPTSFQDETTYAVKQSINGVGALANGAFNILNDEPLFLSAEGIMGIEPTEDDTRRIRNRSYYINKPLANETSLESAVSFIFKGMYWLCVNDHVYVLDGSQKTSWENAKTNLQYEAYYLDNIPAKCFAKKDGNLWFITDDEVCRFKGATDSKKYVDDYPTDSIELYATSQPTDKIAMSNIVVDDNQESTDEWTNDYKTNGITFLEADYEWKKENVTSITIYVSINNGDSEVVAPSFTTTSNGISIASSEFSSITSLSGGDTAIYTVIFEFMSEAELSVNDVFRYGDTYYTIIGFDDTDAIVSEGIPIHAVWGTIADDDGSAHYLKNLQKKGSLVSFLPQTDRDSLVYLKKDEQEIIYVGKLGEEGYTLPFHKYLKKKIKKYKRLQIVCENKGYDSAFGIDEIIKSYTVGNYAKK